MTSRRFSKGQTVYQASSSFMELGQGVLADGRGVTCYIGVVVARVVDASGDKRTTFLERGNDWVFRKSMPTDSDCLYASPDEALAYLESLPHVARIALDVQEDSLDIPTFAGVLRANLTGLTAQTGNPQPITWKPIFNNPTTL